MYDVRHETAGPTQDCRISLFDLPLNIPFPVLNPMQQSRTIPDMGTTEIVTPVEAPQAFVERILTNAIQTAASDIYVLPDRDSCVVRYRVEGAQRDIAMVPVEFGERCITRIKVLAELLTYRTRVAQDGVIRWEASGKMTELRVAVMPTKHGERITIRLRGHETAARRLDELQFQPTVVESLRAMLKQPTGMIILTGPTGCGKTTTIYALIRELLLQQQDPASIITLEDPIECEIEGISQVNIREAEQWGYAEALRASLRQDMKTLIVGEMRDAEVVRITLDAALTGHRIITTYHAGDIPSVYSRMLHQGFEPFLVASAITGILAQRLVTRKDGNGRLPVAAVLQPTDDWREFITRNPSLSELRDKLRNMPMADLPSVAGDMSRQGLITDAPF